MNGASTLETFTLLGTGSMKISSTIIISKEHKAHQHTVTTMTLRHIYIHLITDPESLCHSLLCHRLHSDPSVTLKWRTIPASILPIPCQKEPAVTPSMSKKGNKPATVCKPTKKLKEKLKKPVSAAKKKPVEHGGSRVQGLWNFSIEESTKVVDLVNKYTPIGGN